MLSGPWHRQNGDLGDRDIPFAGELYIERSDFSLEPPKKWKRLAPGEMVRLRYGFIIRCDEVVREGDRLVELRATYFPDSRSGQDKSGLKPNGVVHWVAAPTAVPVEIRSYGRLFNVPNPSAATLIDDMNAESLSVTNGFIEPAIAEHDAERFQFERQGYYFKDPELPGVFNKTVSLREGF